jgi:hypothetical protein
MSSRAIHHSHTFILLLQLSHFNFIFCTCSSYVFSLWASITVFLYSMLQMTTVTPVLVAVCYYSLKVLIQTNISLPAYIYMALRVMHYLINTAVSSSTETDRHYHMLAWSMSMTRICGCEIQTVTWGWYSVNHLYTETFHCHYST